MSSGLLLSVLIEALVFRLSATGGGEDSAFLLELFRDSHANGLVSFLEGGGAGAAFSCAGGAGGGGGNLTGDILPERPWVAPAEFRDSLFGSLGSGPEPLEPSSSKATSSMSDVTDIRWAVSRGDFADGASSPSFSASCLGNSGTSGVGESVLDSLAVDEEDSRLLMSERERDCDRSECELGRGVISGASSKLSPSLSELCELVGLSGFWSISAGVKSGGYGRLLNGDLKGSCSQCRKLLRPAGNQNKN